MPFPISASYDPEAAITALRAADPELGRLIERVGPFALETREMLSPFEHLLRSIVYQQLSTKAAATIHERVLALFPPRGRPTPRALAGLDDETLRGAGLSRPKVAAVRDLAERTSDGTVPVRSRLTRMSDDSILERLTTIRGVGQWTVEMMLIFQLGRPDVLPATDLGVQRGFAVCQAGPDARTADVSRDDLPKPRALLAHGERWRPFRSVASWYLWQANYL